MTNTLAILKAHPLVAILRGVRPMEVLDVAQVLIACGFRVIEVPLNSPQPLESMSTLAASVGPGIVVGAGTVLDIGQVDACAKAGASLILSPNMHTGVVRHTVARGLVSLPGVATASEGFAGSASRGACAQGVSGRCVGSCNPEGLARSVPPGRRFFWRRRYRGRQPAVVQEGRCVWRWLGQFPVCAGRGAV